MKLVRRGVIWWVTQWDNTQKKQVRVSTGESDKDRAMEKAYTLLAPLLTSRTADLVERAAESVKKIRADAAKMESGRIPLADCWRRSPHVSSRKGRPLKPGTVAEYERCWLKFVRHAAGQGITMAEGLTDGLVQDYLATLGSRTRIVTFDLGRAMFDRLGITPSPWIRRPTADPMAVNREPLTMEQVKALLARVDGLAAQANSADDAGEFAIFTRFLLYTGLRLGDAATFPRAQYDAAQGQLARMMAKTMRWVRFPAHPDLAKRFAGLPADGEYLFPCMARLYLAGQDALTKRFARLMAGLGIKGLPHQYCAHALRTTFASICASQGIPLATIQSWLGQECPSVTRIYARVEDMRLKKEAMAKFPTLGE